MESTQQPMTSPSMTGPSRDHGTSRPSPPPIPPQCHSTSTDQWGWGTVSPAQLPMMSYMQNAPPSRSAQSPAQNQYYSSTSESHGYPTHRFLTPSAAAQAASATTSAAVSTTSAAAIASAQTANLLSSQYMFATSDNPEMPARDDRTLPSLMLATLNSDQSSGPTGISVGQLPALHAASSRWISGSGFNDISFPDPLDILRDPRIYQRQWNTSMGYSDNSPRGPPPVVATNNTMGETRVLPNMTTANPRPAQRSSGHLPPAPVSLPPMATDFSSLPDGTIGNAPPWAEWIMTGPPMLTVMPPTNIPATVDPATLSGLQNSANRTTEPLPVPSTLAPESMLLPQPVPSLIPTSTIEPRVRDGPVPVESSRTPRSREAAPERTPTSGGHMARVSRAHRISIRNAHPVIHILRPPASEVRSDVSRILTQQQPRPERSPEVGAGESSNSRGTGSGGNTTPPPPARRHRTDHRRRLMWRHRQRMSLAGQSSNAVREDFDVGRAYHVLRGTIIKKLITRPGFLESGMETVDVNTLNKEDRDCQICYEPFHEQRPEGNTEVPVRLPTCKHLFGNICIAKWLQDSHQCPYCRAELPRAYRITSINKGLSALLERYNPVEEDDISEIEQLRWLDHGLIYKLSQPDCEELIRPTLVNQARNTENERLIMYRGRTRQDSPMESLEVGGLLSDMEYDESDDGGADGGGESMSGVVVQHNAGEYSGGDDGGVEERQRRSTSSSSSL